MLVSVRSRNECTFAAYVENNEEQVAIKKELSVLVSVMKTNEQASLNKGLVFETEQNEASMLLNG